MAETPLRVIFYPIPELPSGVTLESLLQQGRFSGDIVINVDETTGHHTTIRIDIFFITDI